MNVFLSKNVLTQYPCARIPVPRVCLRVHLVHPTTPVPAGKHQARAQNTREDTVKFMLILRIKSPVLSDGPHTIRSVHTLFVTTINSALEWRVLYHLYCTVCSVRRRVPSHTSHVTTASSHVQRIPARLRLSTDVIHMNMIRLRLPPRIRLFKCTTHPSHGVRCKMSH